MTPRELSLDEVKQLQSLPTRQGGTYVRVPGTAKTTKIDMSVRTFAMWFKLPTKAVDCTVEQHDEQEHSRKAMCVEIDGVFVCRYCYLKSLP
jgi:hypothetical protein